MYIFNYYISPNNEALYHKGELYYEAPSISINDILEELGEGVVFEKTYKIENIEFPEHECVIPNHLKTRVKYID